ncbi:Uncharacterized protein Rs2_16364 [Raphanus sativus]|uniref:Uncharacterized protein LOC108831938 n=1 Tax=Raphanus sativus TaxID=3726 RepID=A0A9W3DJV8_RAPSA|nr:uncharacterized protein LOC108831938 [Raphanus sativus]KAJ4902413.1 Uncharacterized protein Rs2_16364 [Raphanus sativus]
MGSYARFKSAHTADIKGKGISYEDDDAPIQLTEQDEAFVIKEYRMSLIGKVLNPKKQDVEKLLQKMPQQWGLQDKITANDLGNGKFLFNFTCEDDLNFVLRQGPFHYNYCMFVLVRWEPIVHDDYPWIVPFWVRIIGIPLHLWTDRNLRNIGGRLGHVDTIDLYGGRLLIDIDSRRPLKFSRKAENAEGEEVTIEFKYEMLFKHCTECGFMTHEKAQCPTKEVDQSLSNRGDVFTRVQLPADQRITQPLLGNARNNDYHFSYQPLLGNQQSNTDVRQFSRIHDRIQRPYSYAAESDRYQPANVEKKRGYGANQSSHRDRIIRGRDERKESHINYSRHGGRPYDRKPEGVWREKKNRPLHMGDKKNMMPGAKEVVPYEQSETSRADERRPKFNKSKDKRPINDQRREEEPKPKRLASTIVTPTATSTDQLANVTIRSLARTLTFSPASLQVELNGLENNQIIGALEDMEIVEQQDDGTMECEIQDDDLLGDELMAIEATETNPRTEANSRIEASRAKEVMKTNRSAKSSNRPNAPLGILNKKAAFLRRGSPRARSSKPAVHKATYQDNKHRHYSKSGRSNSRHNDGLVGSKNSPKHYQ